MKKGPAFAGPVIRVALFLDLGFFNVFGALAAIDHVYAAGLAGVFDPFEERRSLPHDATEVGAVRSEAFLGIAAAEVASCTEDVA